MLAANKFYHIRGGSDRYFFDLNRLLGEAGHSVAPFAMQHPRNEPTPFAEYFVRQVGFWGQVPLWQRIRGGLRTLYSPEARRCIRRLINDWRPDVAHVHLVYHHLSPSFVPILREHDIPVVQTLHDYKPVCPTYSLVADNQICERCKGGRFYQATIMRCNRGSRVASTLNAIEMYLHHGLGWYDLPTTYVVPSAFMFQKLVDFGMNPKKLMHVPNFVEAPEAAPPPVSPRLERTIVYVGRLVPIKGVGTLIRAVGRLRGLGRFRLVIIGEGHQQRELERVAAEEAPGLVRFTGFQDRAAVWRWMEKATAVVVPSECYENCPLVVLEAMACGRAVIGSRIGGIPELILDGETGLLSTAGDVQGLADSIERLLRDYEMSAAMGRAGHARVSQHYAAATHLSRILRVYDHARRGITDPAG